MVTKKRNTRKGRTTKGALVIKDDLNLVHLGITELTTTFMTEYAAKVNLERAIPDFRDGFKPVQRRLLYAAYTQPGWKVKAKSAKLIGTVMGNFHPHGDCLRGDTQVPLLNGKMVTIKELAEKEVGTRWVLAYDRKTKTYKPALARAWRVGQVTDTMIRVTISTGESFETTRNHQFLTDRGWVRAEDLQVADDLRGGTISNEAYRHFASNTGDRKALHVLVGEARIGLLADDEVFHHKDHNRHNNSPSNIEALTRGEHAEEHIENSISNLVSGRKSMFTGQSKLRKAIKEKNSRLLAGYNKNLPVIKAFQAVQFLVAEGIEVTESSYEELRASKGIYNLTKLETLEKKGYTLEQIVEEGEFKQDTSHATGLTEGLTTPRTSKTEPIERYSKQLLKTVAGVFKSLLKQQSMNSITWEDYLDEARRNCSNHGKVVYTDRDRMSTYFGTTDIKEILRQIPARNLCMVTKVAEITLPKKEKFYDFTVDGYENMIVCPARGYGEEDTFVVVHNSGTYGALDTLVNENVPTFTGIGGWSTQTAGASAMRYTECLLSPYGRSLFEPAYIAKEVATFVPNYDRTTIEPLVLPSLLPNLLFNGASGIGVGVATDIPGFTPVSVLDVMCRLLGGEKLTPADIGRKLKFYEQWGGWVDTSKKEVRLQIRSLMENSTGSVEFNSVVEEERSDKSILIRQFASGINILAVVERFKLIPEVLSVMLVDAPVGYRVQFKGSINYNEYDAAIKKIQKMVTTRHSYNITVTERLPLAKEGDVPLGISRDDYQVAFHQLTIPQLMVKWLKWRIEIEVKALAYRIAISNARIAFLKLMILAHDNLDVIMAALRKDDPKAHIMKGLKITDVQAEQILERKVRQLSKLNRQDLKDKTVAELDNLATLQRKAKKPRKEVQLFLEDAKSRFKQVETERKSMIWAFSERDSKAMSEIDGSGD